jgi:hypothetical protein
MTNQLIRHGEGRFEAAIRDSAADMEIETDQPAGAK